jgi:Methyltransferase domain
MAAMSWRYPVAKGLRAVAWRIERPRRHRRQAARLPGLGAFISAGPASGSRPASWFFEQFPRFYMTSSTAATIGRLNLRYEAIIAENRDIFDGASVLDLGSHDGRWSFAALAAGARSVIGIEARPELVQTATETLAGYGYGPDRVRFLPGDVHQALATQDFEADVVLCLGFLYHTLRYNELLDGIRRTNARYLIIDTFSPFMMGPVSNVNVITEDAADEGKAAADIYSHGASVLVGRPNLEAIKTMLAAYGYRVERLSDWSGLLSGNPEAKNCGDYANGKRITARCVSVLAEAAAIDGRRLDERFAIHAARRR